MTHRTGSAVERSEVLPVQQEDGFGVRHSGESSERELLAALYDEHGPRTFRYLLAILGNRSDAEDALHSAFVELARRPGVWRAMRSPAAYLLTTARRIALRNRRGTELSRKQEQDIELLEVRQPAVVDQGEVELLQQAILTLPLEQREVLVLKAFEDMTFQDVANALQISPNTAASRYRYALEKLRALLAGAGPFA